MKKKKSNWTKKGIVFLIAIGFIFSLSIGIIDIMNEFKDIQSNVLSTTTERTVLDVPLSSAYEVDKYIFNGHYLGNYVNGGEANMSVTYNSTENACQLTITNNASGEFVFAGFTPALETTISFEFKHLTWSYNGMSSSMRNYLFGGGVTNYRSSLWLDVTYYDIAGDAYVWEKQSTSWGLENIPWVRYTIIWHADKTFDFSFYDVENKISMFSGSNMTRQNYAFDKPDSLFPSWFFWKVQAGSGADDETDYWMFIRNLKQTITVSTDKDVYADIPSKTYAGWGMDGIYNYTYDNDTQILSSVGAKATVFYNLQQYEGGDWSEADMADLILRGYEFGIHSGHNPDTYDESGRENTTNNFNFLYNLALANGWTYSSIAWTSYGNDYAWAFNDYIYEHYDGSIGRKIWTHFYANMGHLFGVGVTKNTMILNCSERGFSYIGYYHRATGVDPDAEYADFYNLINETIANDLTIVGYIEYWSRYSAPEKVTGSIDNIGMLEKHITMNYQDLILPNNVKIEIRVSEEALDLTPFDEFTLEQNGESLSYIFEDGWLIFEAGEGLIILKKSIFVLENIKGLFGAIGFFGLIILPAVAFWSAKEGGDDSILTFSRCLIGMVVLFGFFVFGFFM